MDYLAPPEEANSSTKDDILSDEVTKAIKRLMKGKSPGSDGISSEPIPVGDELIAKEIHKTVRNKI